MAARLENLREELAALSGGPAPLHNRLLAKIARTTSHGTVEETVPILLDDPLANVDAGERGDLLDMLLRVSEKTQVVYLTDDPVVARWARDQAIAGDVSLFETDPSAA